MTNIMTSSAIMAWDKYLLTGDMKSPGNCAIPSRINVETGACE